MKIDCDLLLNVTDLTNIWLGYCKTSCKQMSNNKKEARNYDNSHYWVKKIVNGTDAPGIRHHSIRGFWARVLLNFWFQTCMISRF